MEFFDIHSHILPGVDDGARDIQTSLELLSMCRQQGITHIAATPHFNASQDNLEDYGKLIMSAYKTLEDACRGKELPQVILGSEVLYFRGMGRSEGISCLCIGASRYLLVEFYDGEFSNQICKDLTLLREHLGIIPIIAHIERYTDFHRFKDLLKLVKSGICYAQVNASAVISKMYKRQAIKLIRGGYVSFLATDTHSTLKRPPEITKALGVISEIFGEGTRDMFIENSQFLLREISNSQTHDTL